MPVRLVGAADQLYKTTDPAPAGLSLCAKNFEQTKKRLIEKSTIFLMTDKVNCSKRLLHILQTKLLLKVVPKKRAKRKMADPRCKKVYAIYKN
jgi:hypothetical protein